MIQFACRRFDDRWLLLGLGLVPMLGGSLAMFPLPSSSNPPINCNTTYTGQWLWRYNHMMMMMMMMMRMMVMVMMMVMAGTRRSATSSAVTTPW